MAREYRYLVLEQGVEIHRRSLLHARIRIQRELHAAASGDPDTDGAPIWDASSYVRVGGSTICVAEGRFFLP